MRYTVTKSVIQMLGTIWMPAVTCAQEKVLSGYDLGNIEQPITRDTVEHWLMLNSGDFQHIQDFCASLEIDGETIDIPWANEESECEYFDCMYPNLD